MQFNCHQITTQICASVTAFSNKFKLTCLYLAQQAVYIKNASVMSKQSLFYRYPSVTDFVIKTLHDNYLFNVLIFIILYMEAVVACHSQISLDIPLPHHCPSMLQTFRCSYVWQYFTSGMAVRRHSCEKEFMTSHSHCLLSVF